MAFTYNNCDGTNDAIDLVRLTVADTVAPGIFQDSEIMGAYRIDSTVAFISPNGAVSPVQVGLPSPRRVAATLLDSLAGNRGRLSGALEVLDIRLDLSKAAAELRTQAKALRQTEADSGSFGIAEMVTDPFSFRERVWKEWMRRY